MGNGLSLNIDKVIYLVIYTVITIILFWLLKWFWLNRVKDSERRIKLREEVFPAIGQALILTWAIGLILLLVSGMFKHSENGVDVGSEYTKSISEQHSPPSRETISSKNKEHIESVESAIDSDIKKEQDINNQEWETFLGKN